MPLPGILLLVIQVLFAAYAVNTGKIVSGLKFKFRIIAEFTWWKRLCLGDVWADLLEKQPCAIILPEEGKALATNC